MSIIHDINSVKDTIPHYWPIGAFIHHNPLKGFESLNFKEGLEKAQAIFGGKVYMDSKYHLDLYKKGKIKEHHLRTNLKKMLQDTQMEEHFELALASILKVDPFWNDLKQQAIEKGAKITIEDQDLIDYLDDEHHYHDKQRWLDDLLRHKTLYEINDILFDKDSKTAIEKSIIEFVSRYLDEEQTTLSMPNRELGMFETFKLYAGLDYDGDAESYIQFALDTLAVTDTKAYLLTHILKLHGWAGFIKYRSQDPDYYMQQIYPVSLEAYLAVRLYYELQHISGQSIADFGALQHYIEENSAYMILKLLKHQGLLSGKHIDYMEEGSAYDEILEDFIKWALEIDAKRVYLAYETINDKSVTPLELAKIMKTLRKEEGYVWLKSLEDSYIESFIGSYVDAPPQQKEETLASVTFCLDVRSEVMRRSLERSGPYETYGAGGFLGVPIAFIEFDKAHELFLCPAIVKPNNVVFELPVESYEDYDSKKGVTKTVKKVLSDLKNNPYTPYIMVEAIGWLFGINLFGKTFSPRKTNRLFERFRPEKPKTTLTIDKLTEEEIETYVKKLHMTVIRNYLAQHEKKTMDDADILAIRDHLVFDTVLDMRIDTEILEVLKGEYKINHADYLQQKEKLSRVGFTLEEKVSFLHNFLTMTGQVENFPPFVVLSGHGSVSDNNPFESALDCGACGGSVSLPNNRVLCMIANLPEVREALAKRGIMIPESTVFIPALHITSTDTITFYDTDHLTEAQMAQLHQIQEDIEIASKQARDERIGELPYTNTQEDIFIKSMDWSEPRPEWGLAKNIGVFAGPRSSIKHMKLDNRYFMHSYDPDVDDEEATYLTKIFDGPLIVGEWINLEHYFSAVENHHYGAGSKVYHNVTGKIGVMYGNYSDLKIGLPTQSVHLEGKVYHEPVRLITVMEAPLEKVGKAVERSIAKEFILNEWIRPVIIDKAAKKVYSYEHGDFIVIKELD